MKALFVIVASMFFSSHINDSDARSELTDTFSGQVNSIIEENKALFVRFQGQHSTYKIESHHPQFTEIKTKLEKAKKIDQKIKVIAIIPSMMIKEING